MSKENESLTEQETEKRKWTRREFLALSIMGVPVATVVGVTVYFGIDYKKQIAQQRTEVEKTGGFEIKEIEGVENQRLLKVLPGVNEEERLGVISKGIQQAEKDGCEVKAFGVVQPNEVIILCQK